MKHIKNNILCIILTIIILHNNLYALANTNVGVINGITNYAILRNQIATILASGLRIKVEFRSKNIQYCNAIAIQKNILLTAGHCLFNTDNLVDKLRTIDVAAFTPIQAEYFKYYSSQLQVITPYIKNNKIGINKDDWAIVKFKSSIPYTAILSKNNISSNISDLIRNDFATVLTNKLYALKQNDINPLYIYWQGAQTFDDAENKVNQYWNYPLTLEESQILFSDDSAINVNLYNVWFTMYYVNDESKNGSIQDGDSGGPLVVCKTQYDDCKLIGLIVSTFTTPKMPIKS